LLTTTGNLQPLLTIILQGGTDCGTYKIGYQAIAANRLDRMLSRLGLLLSVNGGHVGNVNVHKVHAPGLVSQLSQRLDERHALDIADCATELDDTHVRFLIRPIDGDLRDALDPVSDRVRNVRDTEKVSKAGTQELGLNHLDAGKQGWDTYI
jgi:hypothetical protein